MATSSAWQTALAESTALSVVTTTNYFRSLRDAGLYTRPGRGGAHKSSQVTATEHANSILGLAAYQASEAPDAVRALRSCTYSRSFPDILAQKPLTDGSDYGQVLDGMIEGAALALDVDGGLVTLADTTDWSLPYSIEMRFYPSEIKMIWLDDKGAVERIDVYSQSSGQYSGRTLYRSTIIHPSLILLAGRMLHDTPNRTQLPVGNVDTTPKPENDTAAAQPCQGPSAAAFA